MLRSYDVPYLDDDEEDAMGAGARCGRGAETVAAQNEWASHRCVPQGIGPVSLLGF
jgi:hypothetical protein